MATFTVEQGVAIPNFISTLLKDVEGAGIGIEISSGKRMGGKLVLVS